MADNPSPWLERLLAKILGAKRCCRWFGHVWLVLDRKPGQTFRDWQCRVCGRMVDDDA